jgi:ribokinase
VILCYGDLAWDDYRGEDGPRPGGCALNVACSLAAAGAPCGVAGAVGEDGAPLLELLAARGVETALVEVLDGATPRQPIELEAGGERVLRGYEPGVLLDHAPGPALVAALSEAELVYVPVFSATLPWAERAGALRPERPLALDLMDLSDVSPAWIEAAVMRSPGDLLFAGLDPRHQAGWVDRLARWARAPRAAQVVVTLGAAGARLFSRHEAHSAPARPGRIVDTTGCGDALAGAFLAARRAGASAHAALSSGALRASGVASRIGALEPCQRDS